MYFEDYFLLLHLYFYIYLHNIEVYVHNIRDDTLSFEPLALVLNNKSNLWSKDKLQHMQSWSPTFQCLLWL